MTATTPPSRSFRELDFLALPLLAGGGARRVARGFSVDVPWGLARFGALVLQGGWWALEWAGEVDPAGLEIRLSSPGNPLVIAPGDAADTFRLHLEDGVAWDVAALLSPWPGDAAFETLKLRRLGRSEELRLMASGVGRLMTSDRPLTRLSHAAARVLSGRTVGVSTTDIRPSAPATARDAPNDEPRGDLQRIEQHGLVALKRAGQALHPRAFDLAAQAFARSDRVRAVYGDVAEAGLITPRPQWDAELARWWDLAGAPVFLRAEDAPAGDDAPAVVARLAAAGAIQRIPLPLAMQATRHDPALAPVPLPNLARTPRVTAIIPTRFRIDLLEACLAGLIEATGYPDLEVVVVDNGSTDQRLPDVLANAGRRLQLIRVEDRGGFNFPRLIAAGAARATGEVLLLLNDDVEAQETGWLHRLIESAMRPDVGAVGARLLYPDGTVQHAGAVLGIGGVCGHLWKGASPAEQARNPYIAYPGRRMAVTGACLAVRREAYDRVGGLDAEAFPVAFNDIDFCLRLNAAGYRTLYRGDAVLTHHESQSRGTDDANEARRKRLEVETGRFLERWRPLLADDPFGSPAFDPMSEAGLVHRSLRR